MFEKTQIIISWEVFYQYKKDNDNEVKKQPINDPNVNELDCWCLREFRSNRVVESVHYQHGSDGNRNAGLEMLFAKEQGGLEQKKIKGLMFPE